MEINSINVTYIDKVKLWGWNRLYVCLIQLWRERKKTYLIEGRWRKNDFTISRYYYDKFLRVMENTNRNKSKKSLCCYCFIFYNVSFDSLFDMSTKSLKKAFNSNLQHIFCMHKVLFYFFSLYVVKFRITAEVCMIGWKIKVSEKQREICFKSSSLSFCRFSVFVAVEVFSCWFFPTFLHWIISSLSSHAKT